MTTIDNEIMPKLCFKFYCEKCDYGTCKKSSYDNHLLSARHKKTTENNINMPKLCLKYTCENCEKEYNDRAGLWRHKKKCNLKNNEETETDTSENIDLTDKNLILMLIQQNNQLQNHTKPSVDIDSLKKYFYIYHRFIIIYLSSYNINLNQMIQT